MFKQESQIIILRIWQMLGIGNKNNMTCSVSEKQDSFRNIIRQQQIHAYKNAVRFQHLINYCDPQQTVQRIQSTLLSALTSENELYSINNLIQIINICRRLINNYQHCALFSSNQIVQNILIAISQSRNSAKALLQWLKLAHDTFKNWSSLWKNLHLELPNIIWGIISDLSNSDEILTLSFQLLQLLKSKYNISISIDQNKVNLIFEMENFSPVMLRLFSNFLTRQTQEQLQSELIIERLLSLLKNKKFSLQTINLIQKFCFVDPTLLQGLSQCLENRNQDEGYYEDTYKIIKILYQQMFYSYEELQDLAQKYQLFRKYVNNILSNDI